MVNPFDQVNQAMKDRDDKFTKREFAAMHIMAGLLSSTTIELKHKSLLEMALLAIQSADILLQELGRLRGK